MFSGFNLNLNNSIFIEKYYDVGQSLLEKKKKVFSKNIETYILDGIIDGTSLSKDWFPEIKMEKVIGFIDTINYDHGIR